jgi:hypothetical protein
MFLTTFIIDIRERGVSEKELSSVINQSDSENFKYFK